MSITECPHCHRRVAPSDAGDCPSCGENVTKEPANGARMRLLVLKGNEFFLRVCFNCGEPSQRMVKVEVSNVDAVTSLGRALVAYLVPFGKLLSAFEAAKRDVFVTVKLPICDNCRKERKKPELQSFDLESREMRLVVNERFRDMVRRP